MVQAKYPRSRALFKRKIKCFGEEIDHSGKLSEHEVGSRHDTAWLHKRN